jgi:hypothetical protein
MPSLAKHKKRIERLKGRKTQSPIFGLFLKLPAELQLQIWSCALLTLGPRLIDCKAMNFSKKENGKTIKFTQCIANPTNPPLLHACYSSRAMALRQYKVYFEKQLRHPIYFDVSRDTMLLAHLQAAAVFLSAIEDGDVWKGVKFPYLALDPSSHFSSGHLPRKDYYTTIRVGDVTSKLDHFQEIVVLDPAESEFDDLILSSSLDENKKYAGKIEFYLQGMQRFDAAQNPTKKWTCPIVSYITREEFKKRTLGYNSSTSPASVTDSRSFYRDNHLAIGT